MSDKHPIFASWAIGSRCGADKTEIVTRDGNRVLATVWTARPVLDRHSGRVTYAESDEGVANARLIAAAPDLVKALHDVVYQQPNDIGAYSRAISLLHSLNAALAECAKPLSEGAAA